MKIKINWGTSIVIAMVLFIGFILSFVYKTIFVEKYQHHLVSENYYKDELHYQEEIDKIINAKNLIQNVSLKNTVKGIIIQFPLNKDPNKIKGKVIFLRRSDEKLDFEKNIDLTSHSMIIEDSLLVHGKWEIKVDWKYDKDEYLLKESWFY
jgi:hypothetical protein